MTQEMTAQTLRINNGKTLVRWWRKCREVAVQTCIGLSEPIGGPGIVVEIDESMFGKSMSIIFLFIAEYYAFINVFLIGKYNRGKRRDGVWVFGGVEQGTGRCFMVPVKNRKASTLIPIIRHFIEPGTIIRSDCWRAYNGLR